MPMDFTRRQFLQTAAAATMAGKRPNVVIIFLDDSGWSDFRPFGKPPYPTPNVERLAKQGCAFHNFYVPQAICSASRSALMSGCYPGRTKVFGAHPPRARGLDPKFATMGEVLKASGLPDGGVREVAHRRSARNASAGARVRRILRADVLERHVGVPSREPRPATAISRCSSGRTARSRSSASRPSISRC